MKRLSPFPERLRNTFEPAERGVIGVVDNQLDLCAEQGLRLDWQDDRCRVFPLGAGSHETTELPLPKSVFRAIVARTATLCNERAAHSVSLYGGEGELSVGTASPTRFRVALTNTPSTQTLEIRHIDQ